MAIVGSRKWPDVADVVYAVQLFVWKLARKYPGVVVVSGHALCVDRTAEREAGLRGLKVVSFRPEECLPHEVDPLHPQAGFLVRLYRVQPGGRCLVRTLPDRFTSFRDAAFARNTWVVKVSGQVVAFHSAGSPGTANTISEAKRLGRPLYLPPVPATET